MRALYILFKMMWIMSLDAGEGSINTLNMFTSFCVNFTFIIFLLVWFLFLAFETDSCKINFKKLWKGWHRHAISNQNYFLLPKCYIIYKVDKVKYNIHYTMMQILDIIKSGKC